MNPCKCSAVFVGILLFPTLAATADPAAEAYHKGLSCFEKQDYDAAIADFSEATRLAPKDAPATAAGAAPTRKRAISTRPSPTTRRPSGSIRSTPRRITTGASPTGRGASTPGPLPTTTKPSGSIQNTPGHIATAASPMAQGQVRQGDCRLHGGHSDKSKIRGHIATAARPIA